MHNDATTRPLPPRYLDEREVALRLRISRPTLQRWRRMTRAGAPVGPAFAVLGPRRVVYAVAALEAFENAATMHAPLAA